MGRGIVRTFQINQLFNELTPLQSLALTVSAQLGISQTWWKPLGSDPRVAARCEVLLKQFRLDDVMNQQVKLLAYGKRRLLEIATALACEPRVLLLDEPVAGVPEGERQEIFDPSCAQRRVHSAHRTRLTASSTSPARDRAVKASIREVSASISNDPR